MKQIALVVTLLVLVGCGEDEQEIRDRAFEDGYEEGQYDVCRELNSIAPRIKDQIKNCQGL